MSDDFVSVKGTCPACGQGSLAVSFRHLVCVNRGCPNPALLADLLERSEHVAMINEDGWAIEHPLSCRIKSLVECPYTVIALREWRGGPPERDGEYVMTMDPDGRWWLTKEET